MARLIGREDWARHETDWIGQWQGGDANLSIIFNTLDAPGGGPKLHTHPYPETFIIRQGRALFTAGDTEIVPEPGQLLVVPAGVPHKFTNLGPGRLETINIHANGRFVTDWLE